MKYAGVGSRETPRHVGGKMLWCAAQLAAIGFELRSGGANKKKGASDDVVSADLVFEYGCSIKNGHAEIVYPVEPKANKFENFNALSAAPSQEQYDIAVKFLTDGDNPIIPWFDNMTWMEKRLHARNYWQIVDFSGGHVDFVLAYSPLDNKGEPCGGTRTAIKIAERLGIPVFNFAHTMDIIMAYDMIEKLIEENHNG